jgi:hypothetical protein
MQQDRYVIISNIERFEERLKSGLLDEGQVRIVRGLLAEVRAQLDELNGIRRSAHSSTAT